MFRTISDFSTAWKWESEATLKLFRALTDTSLEKRVTPDGRTLGFIAWHIAGSMTYMMTEAGLPLAGPNEKDPMPASAAALVEAYVAGAKAVAEGVPANWRDAQLADYVQMFGESWTKGFMLGSLIAHQCHHRGQMTVLMRQAGLVVPGIYGPSKEEWAHYAMDPQP